MKEKVQTFTSVQLIMNSSFPRRSLDARPVPQSGTEGWEEGDGMVLVPSSPSSNHPQNITLSQEGLRDFMFPEQFGLQLQKKKPIGFFFPFFVSPTPVRDLYMPKCNKLMKFIPGKPTSWYPGVTQAMMYQADSYPETTRHGVCLRLHFHKRV